MRGLSWLEVKSAHTIQAADDVADTGRDVNIAGQNDAVLDRIALQVAGFFAHRVESDPGFALAVSFVSFEE